MTAASRFWLIGYLSATLLTILAGAYTISQVQSKTFTVDAMIKPVPAATN